jgi:hypothetical protein
VIFEILNITSNFKHHFKARNCKINPVSYPLQWHKKLYYPGGKKEDGTLLAMGILMLKFSSKVEHT